jgi:hypothetical protein
MKAKKIPPVSSNITLTLIHLIGPPVGGNETVDDYSSDGDSISELHNSESGALFGFITFCVSPEV